MNPMSSQLADQLGDSEFSFYRALGGVRGIFEAAGPGLVFILTFIFTDSLWWSTACALGIAVVAALLRLASRSSFTQVLAGFFGIAISALWVWKSGRGSDFFAAGLINNVVMVVVFIIAVGVKHDLIGLGVAASQKFPAKWRDLKQFRNVKNACLISSLLWIVLFAARLLVQTPLWWYGSVVWLGIARLLMGVPLAALVVWVSWVMIKNALAELEGVEPNPR